MSYSNDQKKNKTQKNPKMHFLLFSVIKIAKDYLGESIQQFNTFGTESV